jgi:hypothetical protein
MKQTINSNELQDEFDIFMSLLFAVERYLDFHEIIEKALIHLNSIIASKLDPNYIFGYSTIIQEQNSDDYLGPIYKLHLYNKSGEVSMDPLYIHICGEISWKLFLAFCLVNNIISKYDIQHSQ